MIILVLEPQTSQSHDNDELSVIILVFFFQTYRAEAKDDEECNALCRLCFLCSKIIEVKAMTTRSIALFIVNFFFVILYGFKTMTTIG